MTSEQIDRMGRMIGSNVRRMVRRWHDRRALNGLRGCEGYLPAEAGIPRSGSCQPILYVRPGRPCRDASCPWATPA